MRWFPLLTALALGAVMSTDAVAQYAEQVKAQLDYFRAVNKPQGWVETHDDKIEKLAEGESTSFNFNLSKGRTYRIISVCDQDCGDLDLILYDENGNKISEDVSEDSAPIVTATPRWTGKFNLSVNMVSCADDPCLFGIAIMGQ